ncbi:hypothetical protein M9Y10_030976 [Tritrichomonas musculus]|uniref:Uncharacterized protein n=1 Tax=Tritrichomonas musculus TaxID=1915356 RepID=A0ABR2H1G3_9EUKA
MACHKKRQQRHLIHNENGLPIVKVTLENDEIGPPKPLSGNGRKGQKGAIAEIRKMIKT